MKRLTEPELMDDPVQAAAYASADFAEAHSRIVDSFAEYFPRQELSGHVLDLGCGPGDISFRFASCYPECSVVGVDGSKAMIALANQRKTNSGNVGDRITFIEGLIPDVPLGTVPYTAIISNSLLHHLHKPHVLWETIRRYAVDGTRIYVVDLFRPENQATARQLVEKYAAGEPEILRRDFYNSLLAAFEPVEVEAQLATAGLGGLSVAVISDRHLVVHGTINAEDKCS
jgi:SAM-dependent methyltransferase